MNTARNKIGRLMNAEIMKTKAYTFVLPKAAPSSISKKVKHQNYSQGYRGKRKKNLQP